MARTVSAKRPDLLVGACGWDHDAWTLLFFPDDLPREWRLAYYANEFRTVLVPGKTWLQATEQDMVAWREAVDEDFRFYLEAPAALLQADVSAVRALVSRTASALNGAVAAVIVPLAYVAPTSTQQLKQRLAAVSTTIPVILLAEETITTVVFDSVLDLSGVSLGYRVDAAGSIARPARAGIAPAPVALMSTSMETPVELRTLRKVVEQLLASAPDAEDAVLLVAGTPPSIDDLRNARTIAALL